MQCKWLLSVASVVTAGCAGVSPVKTAGILSVAGVLATGSVATAQDSAWYRGPSRNGVYPDAAIRANWKEKAPKILWHKEVGYGFAGAAVVDKKVVTAGYAQETGKGVLYCFDADTGKLIWRVEYEDACGGARGNVVGPVATPVIDGGRVYMVAVMGALYCYDLFTGDKVWEKVTSKDPGKLYGEFGDGASPVIAGDLVLAHLTTATNSASWFAFNKKDGTLVWSHPVKTRLGVEEMADRSYSPAGLCKVNGKSCAILISDAVIDCVELSKGGNVWSHSIADMELRYGPFSEPVFFGNDKFLVGTWYASKANVIAFQINNDGLTRMWTSKAIGKGAYSFVVYKGLAFGYGVKGLNCMDLANGKSNWEWRSSDPKTAKDQGEIILVGDKLVWVSSYSGVLYIGNASPEKSAPLGELKALTDCTKDIKKDKARYNNVVSTTPVFANGRIYLRSSWGELACVDVK
jgi:outer membrane protein assembly factor BamB